MDQPSHSDSDDRFTLFPKLPPELRLKIWDMALRGPRVITILPAGSWSGPDYRFGKCDRPLVYFVTENPAPVRGSVTPLPVLYIGASCPPIYSSPERQKQRFRFVTHLQVNVEARSFALKKSHLAFDSFDLSHRHKYFRFKRDTLELRGCETYWAEEMPEI
jgi:hypothetical protein